MGTRTGRAHSVHEMIQCRVRHQHVVIDDEHELVRAALPVLVHLGTRTQNLRGLSFQKTNASLGVASAPALSPKPEGVSHSVRFIEQRITWARDYPLSAQACTAMGGREARAVAGHVALG